MEVFEPPRGCCNPLGRGAPRVPAIGVGSSCRATYPRPCSLVEIDLENEKWSSRWERKRTIIAVPRLRVGIVNMATKLSIRMVDAVPRLIMRIAHAVPRVIMKMAYTGEH